MNRAALSPLLALTLAACHSAPQSDNDAVARFAVDERISQPTLAKGQQKTRSGGFRPIGSGSKLAGEWVETATGKTVRFRAANGDAPLAFTCFVDGDEARLVVTRDTPADTGAKAILAMIGPPGVLRLPVDAVESPQGTVWRGSVDADAFALRAVRGPTLRATVPGGGELELPAPRKVAALADRCRPRAKSPEADPVQTGQQTEPPA